MLWMSSCSILSVQITGYVTLQNTDAKTWVVVLSEGESRGTVKRGESLSCGVCRAAKSTAASVSCKGDFTVPSVFLFLQIFSFFSGTLIELFFSECMNSTGLYVLSRTQ
jgi:hypothetical protein